LIIGLAGKKRVGKSTVAERLVMHGFEQVSFATPLKSMASVLLRSLGMTNADIHAAALDKEAVLPVLGVSYRSLLQTLGTDWGRTVHPRIWLLCAEHRLAELDQRNVIFDDVRFDNEAELIRDRGGLIIHLIRHTGEMDKHASEFGVLFQPGDELVGNNGTLEGLFNRVFTAMEKKFGEEA
jgi:hypothetical protein